MKKNKILKFLIDIKYSASIILMFYLLIMLYIPLKILGFIFKNKPVRFFNKIFSKID